MYPTENRHKIISRYNHVSKTGRFWRLFTVFWPYNLSKVRRRLNGPNQAKFTLELRAHPRDQKRDITSLPFRTNTGICSKDALMKWLEIVWGRILDLNWINDFDLHVLEDIQWLITCDYNIIWLYDKFCNLWMTFNDLQLILTCVFCRITEWASFDVLHKNKTFYKAILSSTTRMHILRLS